MIKKWCFGILATFIAIVVAVILLEMATRVVYSRKLDYQIEMSRYAAFAKQPAADPRMGHEHIPGVTATLMGVPVSINSFGFRDKERSPARRPGTYRVLVLGDSLTFGWGVKEGDTFANLLERRLNDHVADKNPKTVFECINTGIGNYNTDQEVALFEHKGEAWKPDLVILCYFINDAEPTPTQRLPRFLCHTYLGMWLWGRLDMISRRFGPNPGYEAYYTGLYRQGSPGWEVTQKALKRLGNLAKQDRFKLVVALLPELHGVGKQYRFQEIHDMVKQAALEGGADDVIDLAPYFKDENPPDLWVSPDDAHPNARAHRLMADALYHRLLNENWRLEREH